MKIQFLCAFAGGVLMSAPALAHHSFALFDATKELPLSGTVKEMQWTNPHTWIQLMVMDKAGGTPQEWSIEGQSPNVLAPKGWRRNTIKAGDHIEITIHPLKSGAMGGSLVKLLLINGQPGPDRTGALAPGAASGSGQNAAR